MSLGERVLSLSLMRGSTSHIVLSQSSAGGRYNLIRRRSLLTGLFLRALSCKHYSASSGGLRLFLFIFICAPLIAARAGGRHANRLARERARRRERKRNSYETNKIANEIKWFYSALGWKRLKKKRTHSAGAWVLREFSIKGRFCCFAFSYAKRPTYWNSARNKYLAVLITTLCYLLWPVLYFFPRRAPPAKITSAVAKRLLSSFW